MVVAKKIVLVKKCEGFPKESDFKIEEEELRPIKDDEFLAEALYLSVDPFMRAYMSFYELNTVMAGFQVAKIIESKSKKFPVGSYVVTTSGWRTHTIIQEKPSDSFLDLPIVILPDIGDLPLSLGIGYLGMPGNTAYFGFLEICQPKAGETVVVTGAAGAVGSQVGQIAKIKGCKVIGIAGSEEKRKWLVEELGFNHFINYKTDNVEEELKKIAPNGIDCFFDNMGGNISTTIMNHMNPMGRVSICGAISGYNNTTPANITLPQILLVQLQLRIEGFVVSRWTDRWMEGINQNLQWIKEGKIKYKETVTEGFENTFKAFVGMLAGDNIGKAVVKV